MSAAEIEDFHTARIVDKTGEVLFCELATYSYPEHRRTSFDGAPDVRLKTLTFPDHLGKVGGGVECRSPGDHARFLTIMRKGEPHLDWHQAQEACADAYFAGETNAADFDAERDIDHGDEVSRFASATGGARAAGGGAESVPSPALFSEGRAA